MTDQFQKRYPLHDRRSVHKVSSTTGDPFFSHLLDQVSPDGNSLDRLARDVRDLGSLLQANGMRITIIPQPMENDEHNAE